MGVVRLGDGIVHGGDGGAAAVQARVVDTALRHDVCVADKGAREDGVHRLAALRAVLHAIEAERGDKKRVERSKRGSSHALPLFTFNEPVATKAGATASRDR